MAPWDVHCLTPAKLAAFYRLVGGNYDVLFIDSPNSSLAFIYKSLGCFHSLQPDKDPFAAPSMPALTPQGFVRWQTVQLLLGPEEHVPFLQEAVKRFDIINPSDGGPFPKLLPADSLPRIADPDMTKWHEGVGEKLRLECESVAPRSASHTSRPPDIESQTESSVNGQSMADAADYFQTSPRNPNYAHINVIPISPTHGRGAQFQSLGPDPPQSPRSGRRRSVADNPPSSPWDGPTPTYPHPHASRPVPHAVPRPRTPSTSSSSSSTSSTSPLRHRYRHSSQSKSLSSPQSRPQSSFLLRPTPDPLSRKPPTAILRPLCSSPLRTILSRPRLPPIRLTTPATTSTDLSGSKFPISTFLRQQWPTTRLQTNQQDWARTRREPHTNGFRATASGRV